MSNAEFKGVIVPTATPLTPDEAVDVGSLRRLVRFLINSGVHGIWAAGTTGEFGALEDDQRLLAIETIVAEVNGQVPVIANVSGPGTGIAIKLARSLQESGVDGIAATPPYYYNYDQGELISHYRSIHECSSIPLWVYNIPSTVKINVEPTTIAQLAAEGTIVGMKDSTGLGENLAQLVVCVSKVVSRCTASLVVSSGPACVRLSAVTGSSPVEPISTQLVFQKLGRLGRLGTN